MFYKFHNPLSITGIKSDKSQSDSDALMYVEHTGLDLNRLHIGIMKFKSKGDLGSHRENLLRY